MVSSCLANCITCDSAGDAKGSVMQFGFKNAAFGIPIIVIGQFFWSNNARKKLRNAHGDMRSMAEVVKGVVLIPAILRCRGDEKQS